MPGTARKRQGRVQTQAGWLQILCSLCLAASLKEVGAPWSNFEIKKKRNCKVKLKQLNTSLKSTKKGESLKYSYVG